MAYVKEDIINGMCNIGVKNGDVILVHSSLKSLGYVSGGPITVINAILEVIGEEGTLVVPTLSGKREDSPNNPPVFDVVNTPCWTGIIPETVRKMENSKRSCHPTHSVAAIGYNKEMIIQEHEKSSSPCDKYSPYYKIARRNGYILLVGVDQESNTSVHSCEEIAGVPYHLQKEYTEAFIKGYQDKTILIKNRLHNWNKPPTDFNKLDNIYKEKGIMIISKICDSTIRLIRAADMFDITIKLLEKNPLFLVNNV